ncbi:hypothetical protein M1D88_18835 [Arthrobacter sp. R1-13]
MLVTSRESIIADLLSYGEKATAEWISRCSDDELMRTLSVGEWLLYYGPGPASGGSMLIGKAAALAAVYVHEGNPRDLTRRRRDLSAWAAAIPSDGTARLPGLPKNTHWPKEYGVGTDAKDYWTHSD